MCIGCAGIFLNFKLNVEAKAAYVEGNYLGEKEFAGFLLPWEHVCVPKFSVSSPIGASPTNVPNKKSLSKQPQQQRRYCTVSKPDQQRIIGEAVIDIGLILNQIADALEEHEKRLRMVEISELRAVLAQVECKIRGLHDLDKQAQASEALKNLARLFGIFDFSDC